MPWVQGNDNYYVTQDTDYGYHLGIEVQWQHFSRIIEFLSEGDSSYYSNSRRYS